MSVATLSVRRPVLMTVMALVIILLGAFGASNLGVREYPNVDYPLIQVRTSYPGISERGLSADSGAYFVPGRERRGGGGRSDRNPGSLH